jgi:hypothetical protein
LGEYIHSNLQRHPFKGPMTHWYRDRAGGDGMAKRMRYEESPYHKSQKDKQKDTKIDVLNSESGENVDLSSSSSISQNVASKTAGPCLHHVTAFESDQEGGPLPESIIRLYQQVNRLLLPLNWFLCLNNNSCPGSNRIVTSLMQLFKTQFVLIVLV